MMKCRASGVVGRWRLATVLVASVAILYLSACREDDVDIAGSWRPVAVAPELLPSSLFRLSSITVTFRDDGTWQGETGCPGAPGSQPETDSGTYSVDGSTLRASVENIDAGCATAEFSYETLLFATAKLQLQDETLRMLDADGDLLAEFEPADD